MRRFNEAAAGGHGVRSGATRPWVLKNRERSDTMRAEASKYPPAKPGALGL
jgi:hypothetical protein